MRKPLFHFVMVVMLLAGCGRREDVSRLMIINQSLENANQSIQDENKVLEKALYARVCTPRTSYYGKLWEPRGRRIKNEADSMVAIIENLKKALLKQTDSLRKEDPSFIKQLNETDGPGYKLVQRWASVKDSIPVIFTGDSSLRYDYIQSEIHDIYAKAPLMYGYSPTIYNC